MTKSQPATITVDIHCLTDGTRGRLEQGAWGDARETACLMSALTGATSIEGCVAAGWHQTIAELGTVIFDNAPPDEMLSRSIAFAEAVIAADARGADFDRVIRDIRMNAILPIAMESIGDGDDPWQRECRAVVQWSLDNDGKPAWSAWTARAAEAARAARAAGAAWAPGAARAARAAAHTRIFNATIAALRGEI